MMRWTRADRFPLSLCCFVVIERIGQVQFSVIPEWGDDLGSEHERYVAEKVLHSPSSILISPGISCFEEFSTPITQSYVTDRGAASSHALRPLLAEEESAGVSSVMNLKPTFSAHMADLQIRLFVPLHLYFVVYRSVHAQRNHRCRCTCHAAVYVHSFAATALTASVLAWVYRKRRLGDFVL